MAERCAVIGVGQTRHAAKRSDVSMPGLVREAALRALEEARKLIPHPTLRRFKVGPYIADEPLADIGADGAFQHPRWRMGDDGQWRTVDNERFGLDWISAVAAWFAHEVRISQDVPVGLIESNFVDY